MALGLPVLDGCMIVSATPGAIDAGAEYMKKYGRAIVRSDPLHKDSMTIRGGDVWELANLRAAAEKYMPFQRALILLEPYERTANEWSFAIAGAMPHNGFVIEIVGPGFDTGHLNRGRVTPHESFVGEYVPGMRPQITTHTPFDEKRYAREFEEFNLPPRTRPATGLPESILSRILQHYRKVADAHPGSFVLSGAVLQPGERLIFWDIYDATHRNR
jgi:hypothetical protein